MKIMTEGGLKVKSSSIYGMFELWGFDLSSDFYDKLLGNEIQMVLKNDSK